MRIAVASDHRGVDLKRAVIAKLENLGHEVTDEGADGADSVDYPDFASVVAGKVSNAEIDRGVLICGTGIGVAMSANKIPGIRAAQCHDTYSAAKASTSNNAQIITMGARVIGPELAKDIADAFLSTAFDPEGRSAGNVNAINEVDAKYNKA